MEINWYPGHMAKAMRLIKDDLKIVDVVIVVLDSRIPASCINPHFLRMTGNKPILYVLGKADLADRNMTYKWQNYLTEGKNKAVVLNATSLSEVSKIVKLIENMAAYRTQKLADKGVIYTPRVMVAGIPNTGKSTIINSLCKKSKTLTGNKAGVTRQRQWVKINGGIELLDTPGVLPPKLNDIVSARHIGYVGSIKDEIIDNYKLSLEFIKEIKELYSDALAQRYGITLEKQADGILEDICRARGFLLKGGELDIERGAAAVLDDFKSGKMGKITLEHPPK